MSNVRDRIETWFGRVADRIFRHRWLTLAMIVVLVAALATGIPKLKVDTSTEGFLHPQDPILIDYFNFRDLFGRDDMIVVAIETDELFTFKTLDKIRALHRELADKVPHLNDITSIINARSTRGEGDVLVVGDLMEHWPQTEQDLADLKARVMTNPLYKNQLVSEDGRFTAMALEMTAYTSNGQKVAELAGFGDDEGTSAKKDKVKPKPLTDEETQVTVKAVEKIVNKYRAEGLKIYLAGTPVVTNAVKQSMMADMGRFLKLALLVIGVSLFAMFRRISGVLYPLIIVGLSLASTLGLMGHLGVAFKTPTMILPSFLLAVGVGASVHLLALFYQDLQKSGHRRPAIIEALGHSGLAIVMTSLTTAAGLASFSTAQVAPIADLGVFASIGVLLSLVLTIVLMPAMLAIAPIKPKKNKPGRAAQGVLVDRFLERLAQLACRRAKLITVVSLAIIVVSIFGLAQLRFRHDVLRWLPNDRDVREATLAVDKNLRGSVAMEMVIDTGRKNGLYDPVLLAKMDSLAREMEKYKKDWIFVGKVTSVADIIKEINQALNENRPDFYKVPSNPALVPQEFLLFENSGSDDLENFVDSQFRLARVTLKVPFGDALPYVGFLNHVEKRFRQVLGPGVKVHTTGILALLVRTVGAAIYSMAESYIIAFVVITLMMILLIGNLKLGLLSMLPNLAPILATVALMGWFDWPFDMFTMLVGSIAIGLAVDDTVHFMHNFRRYYSQTGDAVQSVSLVFHTAGRAMLVTSVVLSLGFFIFMLASMNNIFYFGLLTGLATIAALVADFLLSPALMVLAHPKKPIAAATPTAAKQK